MTGKYKASCIRGRFWFYLSLTEEPVRQDVLAILNQVSANIKRFIGVRILFQLSEVYRQITETASVFQKLERMEKKIEKRDEKSGMREAICLEKIRGLGALHENRKKRAGIWLSGRNTGTGKEKTRNDRRTGASGSGNL